MKATEGTGFLVSAALATVLAAAAGCVDAGDDDGQLSERDR